MFTQQGKVGWTGWSPANQRGGCGAPPASAPIGKAKRTSQRAAELEEELHKYQYHMGLLLIEKIEQAAKLDEVSQVLAQNEEILKWEQAAHLNAVSEYERREENTRKALGVEKQCVADLEKAVREICEEIDLVKFTSQKKIADAQSIEAILEEKSLEIEKSIKITLKTKEEDITKRLNELRSQEKDAESKRKTLEERERMLSEREEKASAREKTGLQKLVEDHKANLESEMRDFELELESSFDENMKHREADLVKKEKELRSREDKISRSEQALDGRKTKLAELQNDLDTKSKALKKWDESLKTEEKKFLQLERELKQADMYKSDIESLKATIEAEKKRLLEEQNNLKVTEEERQDHSLLTAQLKKEIADYRMRSNSLSDETEDLRKQRQKFEEEWEQLDEKRARLEEEAKNLKNEKAHLERWHDNEEKRFKDAQDEMDAKYREQQENLILKEALLDELEMEMENRLAKKERELEEKENELNKKRDFVEDQLKQKIMLEKQQFQRERDALVEEQQQFETEKADIREDIDSLNKLSKSLKERREAYITERNDLMAVFEKYKVCKSCGVSIFEGFGDPSLKDSAHDIFPSLTIEGDDRSPNTDTLAEDTEMRVNSSGGFDEENDDQEDSVTVGGTRKPRLAGVAVGGQRRSKRRQAAGPSTQAPGEKRYDLRRTTVMERCRLCSNQ